MPADALSRKVTQNCGDQVATTTSGEKIQISNDVGIYRGCGAPIHTVLAFSFAVHFCKLFIRFSNLALMKPKSYSLISRFLYCGTYSDTSIVSFL